MRKSNLAASAQATFEPERVAQIRAQVDKLIASAGFSNSQRKRQLLCYLVDAALDERAAELNEYAIALDVFERPASFDPRIDSTVRAEISRFRARLKEYYSGPGRSDPVVISLSEDTRPASSSAIPGSLRTHRSSTPEATFSPPAIACC